MTDQEKIELLSQTVELYARATEDAATYKNGKVAREALALIAKARTKPTIYSDALLYIGEKPQIKKAIEELSELTIALARFLNAEHEARNRGGMVGLMDQICEELADVQIMLEQLKLIFPSSKINTYYTEKLIGLRKRLIEQYGYNEQD